MCACVWFLFFCSTTPLFHRLLSVFHWFCRFYFVCSFFLVLSFIRHLQCALVLVWNGICFIQTIPIPFNECSLIFVHLRILNRLPYSAMWNNAVCGPYWLYPPSNRQMFVFCGTFSFLFVGMWNVDWINGMTKKNTDCELVRDKATFPIYLRFQTILCLQSSRVFATASKIASEFSMETVTVIGNWWR